MPASLNGKQIIAIILGVALCSGLSALVGFWVKVDSASLQHDVRQRQIEEVSLSLARFEVELKKLRGEVRQATIVGMAIKDENESSQPRGALNKEAVEGKKPMFMGEAPENGGSDLTADKVAVTTVEQETVQVTAILDVLRTRDRAAYPDLPTLMTSPEMDALSPAARDAVMTEVTKMLNSGELDMASFLHNRSPKP